MRPASCEDVITEIDQRMFMAPPDIGETIVGIDRRIRSHGTQCFGEQHLRLITEGAAAEEPADVLLPRV